MESSARYSVKFLARPGLRQALAAYLLFEIAIVFYPCQGFTQEKVDERVESAVSNPNPKRRRWAFGGQLTGIGQFNTPLSGPDFNPDLSFGPGTHFGWSGSISAYAAVSPWKGGVFMVEPEYANGRGMPNASGIAGYPNGETVRAGSLGKFPPPYVARGFYFQAFPLGKAQGEEVPEFEDRFLPSDAHYLGRVDNVSRIELTLGKFTATDFFDSSEIGTDPRHHFLNWSLMQEGAWDAAADARGYTYGIVLALEKPRFAVRAGMMLMPKEANGSSFDWNVLHSRSEMVEGELHYRVRGQAGSVKMMMYVNHAHMGNYNAALAAAPPGIPPDIASVEKVGAIKYGGGVLVDQEINDDIRVFFRAGANDGQTETFAFTEIDRSVSFGVDVAGAPWKRPKDHLAFAMAFNGLSGPHHRYLSAGGKGFQLGDGGLSYAWEVVSELYYKIPITRYLEITADAQGIVNPGMNSAHTPTGIFGLRIHAHI